MQEHKGICYDSICIQNKRPNNMDAVYVEKRVFQNTELCLAVVCDGVGSLKDGAFASYYAVDQLQKWFASLSAIDRLGIRLRDRILQINEEIIREADKAGLETASTLSALLIEEGSYYIVHLGDSRIYGYNSDGLKQLTADHSVNGILTSYIGRKHDPRVLYDEGSVIWNRFLLCSDGIYKRVNHEEIEDHLSDCSVKRLKKGIANLVNRAIEYGESDNISAVILVTEK